MKIKREILVDKKTSDLPEKLLVVIMNISS